MTRENTLNAFVSYCFQGCVQGGNIIMVHRVLGKVWNCVSCMVTIFCAEEL